MDTPISLGADWNLVSYLPSESGAMPDVLNSIDGSYSYVGGYKSSIEGGPGFETYVPGRPFNDLNQLSPLHGYWIKMDSGGTLTYPTSVPQPQAKPVTVKVAPSLESILGSESISGQVSDGTQGIEGATVQAWQNNVKIKETTTSSDGSYSLDGLAASSYYLRGLKDGYYTNVPKEPKAAPQSGVDIILEPLPSITPSNVIPCDFWSQSTTTKHSLLQIGDVITAKDPDGVICGLAFVGDAGTGEGDYFIHVNGDDPQTTGIDEGAEEGDQITFYINKEYDCEQTGTWTSGGSIELNLDADYSLPVTLSAFSATMMEDKVVVQWQTQTEQDNLGWDVYRSDRKDGKYTKINAKIIAGAGTSATSHDYKFVDEEVETDKTYFYYLENIDQNGEQHKSHIIRVISIQPTVFGKIKCTALLPNYPNPFNPDTWIPFQLAHVADVSVTIYSATGQLIRTLSLGKLPTGSYTQKEKAAYWDGKNDIGERVSSGVYFYHLKAGDFNATKRMLIVK